MHPNSPRDKERKLRISEVFYSIEGEGPFTGLPTVFVRTFGCNFTCSGFGSPTGAPVIPIKIDRLDDFKPTVGCDSIYSWHPQYKDLTKWYTMEELAGTIIDLLPEKRIVHPRSGQTPILSLTGGEPTLHQRSLTQLLMHEKMRPFNKLLIETNGAVTLTPEFIQGLNDWVNGSTEDRFIMWSNSPKLSISGERFDDAIRPEVISAQMQVRGAAQYFKFVSDGTAESFAEIKLAMETYGLSTITSTDMPLVYVMPVGATGEEQARVQKEVALRCLEEGYAFCARVHCFVFENAIGT